MTINNQNSVFNSFPKYSNLPVRDAVNSGAQNNKIKSNNNEGDSFTISSVQVSDAAKNKRHKILVWTVLSTVVTAGAAALFLTKGFSSNSYNKINKLISSINEKISAKTANAANKKTFGIFRNFNIAIAKGTKKILTGLKGAANFNAVKDSTTDLVLKSNKFTAKIADDITGWFQKISFNSVVDAYGSAGNESRKLRSALSTTVKKLESGNVDLNQVVTFKDGTSKTLKECLDLLNIESDNVVKNLDANFDIRQLEQRKLLRQDYIDGKDTILGPRIKGGLNKRVREVLYDENGGIFRLRKNANKYKNTYITEDIIQPGKDFMAGQILSARRSITSGISHNADEMRIAMQDILAQAKIDDNETAKILNKINNEIKSYGCLDGNGEVAKRSQLVNKIGALMEELKVNVSSSGYSNEAQSIMESSIDSINRIMASEKGGLEEINTVLKALKDAKILSLDDIKELRGISDNTSRLLTKASDIEMGEMFDKFAEFKVGSAPTDVIGLATPVGAGVYALSKAKDKDERTSVALTAGVPIVGGLGVVFWGTMKNFSGPKNLIFALGASLGLSVVGKTIDKVVKSYKEKKSFTQVAVDAYKNSVIPQKNEK